MCCSTCRMIATSPAGSSSRERSRKRKSTSASLNLLWFRTINSGTTSQAVYVLAWGPNLDPDIKISAAQIHNRGAFRKRFEKCTYGFKVGQHNLSVVAAVTRVEISRRALAPPFLVVDSRKDSCGRLILEPGIPLPVFQKVHPLTHSLRNDRFHCAPYGADKRHHGDSPKPESVAPTKKVRRIMKSTIFAVLLFAALASSSLFANEVIATGKHGLAFCLFHWVD
jgi:hypothetical protein